QAQAKTDRAQATYQKNEATTRDEIRKKEDLIQEMQGAARNLQDEIKRQKDIVLALKTKEKPSDPFQYDEPQGKITQRLADNIVEINIGSNVNVQTGLTFTVLPNDYPQKGRGSRMVKDRIPADRGNYKQFEISVRSAPSK